MTAGNHPNPHEDAHRHESIAFQICLFLFEVFLIIIYGVWIRYDTSTENTLTSYGNVTLFYNYFRDIQVMIFFGFGFLMTFLRRYAFSAVGYTLLISALVVQWSVPLRGFFLYVSEPVFEHVFKLEFVTLLDALFCAGAVMITFGAFLGKVTPLQLLLVAFIEPILFFLNIYICGHKLHAFDIGGGMYIHTFGAYFGLSMARFLTTQTTKSSPDNTSGYYNDIFAMAGTLFLWMMWPSFNAAIALPGDSQLRALINTFLSLTGSTIATFLFSRLLSHHKFEMVHVQNSTLAGGVAQGVMAHLNITPAGAIVTGFVAGTVSVFGYSILTPFLNRKFSIQDICGIHNLHGMPGFIGSVGAIIAAAHAVGTPSLYGSEEFTSLFPAGSRQAGMQAAALLVTLAIAIIGGTFTGFLAKQVGRLTAFGEGDWFHDRRFWVLPSDYHSYKKNDTEMSHIDDDEKDAHKQV